MASAITLYWGSGSVPCWRAMLTLAEKGISGYNSKQISFDKEENKCPEILALNPRGEVPTCKIGDLVINESWGLCDFFEAVYQGQGTRLLPENKESLAVVLQRKYETLSLTKKANDDLVYYLFITKPEAVDQDYVKTKKDILKEELKLWDGYLAKLGEGSYIAGKDFSMADVMLFPQVAFMVRLGLQLSPYLAKYYELVKSRPSVTASWPPHSKGSEGSSHLKDL